MLQYPQFTPPGADCSKHELVLVCVFLQVRLFQNLEKETPIDPDKISEGIFIQVYNKLFNLGFRLSLQKPTRKLAARSFIQSQYF